MRRVSLFSLIHLARNLFAARHICQFFSIVRDFYSCRFQDLFKSLSISFPRVLLDPKTPAIPLNDLDYKTVCRHTMFDLSHSCSVLVSLLQIDGSDLIKRCMNLSLGLVLVLTSKLSFGLDLSCLLSQDTQTNSQCLSRKQWASAPQKPWVIGEKVFIKHFYSRGSFVLDREVKAQATIKAWKEQRPTDPDKASNSKVDRIFVGELSGGCTGEVRIEVVFGNRKYDDLNLILVPSGNAPCNHMSLHFSTEPGEVFSGAGEQFTYLFLNSQVIDTLSQEQGHGKGKQPITWIGNKLGGGAGGREGNTYAGHPLVMSSRGRGLFLNDPYQIRLDFKTKGIFKIQSLVEKPLRLSVMENIEPKDLTYEYTRRFGRMRTLPDWVHRGMMLGIQGGRAKIEKAIQKLQAHQGVLSSLWIQDWVGQRQGMFWQRLKWHWDVDRSLYPDWEKLVQDLDRLQLKTVSYFNARFSPLNECSTHCDFDKVINNGFAVSNPFGQPYLIGSGGFDFVKLDLTNPNATQWFYDRMKQHSESGIKGLMVDFSESLPFDVKLFNGQDPQEYHGNYIRDWAQLSRNVLNDKVGEDAFVMMRGGNQLSLPFVNSYWAGDQLETWDRFDGMHSALIGMMSGGLAGMGITHSDIGGVIAFPLVNYRRTEELYLRWLQMSSFTAIMRTHEGSNPESTHQFDSTENSLKQTAFYSRLYSVLFHYRKNLLSEYRDLGVPLIRTMYMENPQDPIAWQIDDQFYLGPDIIVAPVLKPGMKKRGVWLPPGSWIQLFKGCELTQTKSSYLNVDTPIDSIPVFVREESEAETTLTTFMKREQDNYEKNGAKTCAIL